MDLESSINPRIVCSGVHCKNALMRPFQMEIFLGSFDYAPIGIVIPRDFVALRAQDHSFLSTPKMAKTIADVFGSS